MSMVKKPNNLEEELTLLKQENVHLREQLSWFKKQLFGAKSERFIDSSGDQLDLPGIDLPAEENLREEEPKPARRRRKRRSTKEDTINFPEDLPKETIFLDVPEEEKTCPETGEPLQKIGEVVLQKLAFKPGNFFIKEFIKPKYASKNHPEFGVITADSPEGIFPRSKIDESLLAKIITMKFADHLPLYRIQEIFERDQVKISRQALSEWVISTGQALLPLYEIMKKRILEDDVLFTDESHVKLLVKGKKKAQKAFMWIYTGGGGGLDPPYSIFEFCCTRSHEYPKRTLAGYKGYLHSDKYGAYEALAKIAKITWCPCMAHIRRYFIEAKTGDQEFCKYVLRKIRYLYMFEKVAKRRMAEERLQIRQEKEKPIIQELVLKVKAKLVKGNHLPKSKYRKALGYFMGCSPYLENYLSNPWAHIDNNISERRIRCLAIGRKNWMFVGSEDGGQSAAVLLSIVQTCRHLGINPQEYLEDVMRKMMSHPMNKLDELLPDQWQKNRALIVT